MRLFDKNAATSPSHFPQPACHRPGPSRLEPRPSKELGKNPREREARLAASSIADGPVFHPNRQRFIAELSERLPWMLQDLNAEPAGIGSKEGPTRSLKVVARAHSLPCPDRPGEICS